MRLTDPHAPFYVDFSAFIALILEAGVVADTTGCTIPGCSPNPARRIRGRGLPFKPESELLNSEFVQFIEI